MLKIDGELTIYQAQDYKTYLAENFDVNLSLEIDLAEVDEIDSCGLQLLLTLCKQLTSNNQTTNIIASSDAAMEALTSCQLMTNTTFFDTGPQYES